MNKLIVKESHSPSSRFWPNLVKYNRLTEFSVETLLNKYKGFEGEEIIFLDYSSNDFDLEKIKSEYLEIDARVNRSLLCLISENDIPSPLLTEQAVKVGYDVGVCEEEKTVYSSIFNEIIFGNLNELILCKNALNEYLLFPSKNIAEEYVNLHTELSKQGKGVEDYEEMIIYEIWKLI
jgi:hypothetical protein